MRTEGTRRPEIGAQSPEKIPEVVHLLFALPLQRLGLGVAGSNPATPTSFPRSRSRHGERYPPVTSKPDDWRRQSPSLGRFPEEDCREIGPSVEESSLLQVDGLIVSGLVELCTPHLMHALVVGPAEDHGRSKSNVEVTEIFQSPD
jgi:hypothetical protein